MSQPNLASSTNAEQLPFNLNLEALPVESLDTHAMPKGNSELLGGDVPSLFPEDDLAMAFPEIAALGYRITAPAIVRVGGGRYFRNLMLVRFHGNPQEAHRGASYESSYRMVGDNVIGSDGHALVDPEHFRKPGHVNSGLVWLGHGKELAVGQASNATSGAAFNFPPTVSHHHLTVQLLDQNQVKVTNYGRNTTEVITARSEAPTQQGRKTLLARGLAWLSLR